MEKLGIWALWGHLYRDRVSDLSPHLTRANQVQKPSLAALLFILQCAAPLSPGTGSSASQLLTVSALERRTGLLAQAHRDRPSSAGIRPCLPVWQGEADRRPVGTLRVPELAERVRKD